MAVDRVDRTTVAGFAPTARKLCPPASLDTYGAGFDRLVELLGTRALEDVRLVELEAQRDLVHRQVGAERVSDAVRRGRALVSYDPDAHGHGAAENYVRSARFFFRSAVKLGLLTVSPAAELQPPRRPPSPERPLSEAELLELRHVAGTTGHDRELDVLVLDFLRHTAARREGVLNLRLVHLDPAALSVVVSEKRGRVRRLPLSGHMLDRLERLGRARGAAAPHDHVFRYRNGEPLTRRRFNSIFDRLDRHTHWSQQLDVGAHWLRHTTLTDIAAVSGTRVAQVFAGHQPGRQSTIERYTHVDFEDLVAAYEALFGAR